MDYRSIQDETIEILMDYDICKTPIDIESLMKKMDIGWMPYSHLNSRIRELSFMNSKEGYNDFDEDEGKFYIYYNDKKPPARVKFTYGHEIRHIVHMDVYEDDEIRAEANYFSRFLLVPIPLLKEIGIQNESELIYIFEVSPDVAKYSLDFLNKHGDIYREYNEIEKEFIKMFDEEIKRCKCNLKDYRDRMNNMLEVEYYG